MGVGVGGGVMVAVVLAVEELDSDVEKEDVRVRV